MNALNHILLWAAATLVPIATAYSQASTAPTAYAVKETRLGPIPAGSAGIAEYSDDFRHFAYVANGILTDRLFVDGQAIAESTVIDGPRYSPDGNHFAYEVDRGHNKWTVVVDGKSSPEYDMVGDDPPVFSPDSKSVAYAAQTGKKWSVILNGQAGPEFDHVDSLVFSADSKNLAYSATRGEKSAVVVNGQAGAEYDAIMTTPVFSKDGKRLGYVADEGGQSVVVVDGKPGPVFGEVGDMVGDGVPIFSPDSMRFAYMAWADQNDTAMKAVVVVDGQKDAPYDAIAEGSLIFSPDSKHVAYVARKGDKSFAVVDGKASVGYDMILCGSPLFSADSKHMALAARNGEKWLVIVDGKPGTEYDAIGDSGYIIDPAHRGADNHEVYAPKDGPDWCGELVTPPAIANPPTPPATGDLPSPDDLLTQLKLHRLAELAGTAPPDDAATGKPATAPAVQERFEFMGTGTLRFSPDGNHVAYAARIGQKWSVVVDGQAGATFDAIGKPGVIFSHDGQHMAYMARTGQTWSLVLDGQPGASCDDYRVDSVVFSSDDKHLAYDARSNQKWFVIMDGQPGPAYDLIGSPSATYRPDGVLEYLAVKSGSLYRVEYTPER